MARRIVDVWKVVEDNNGKTVEFSSRDEAQEYLDLENFRAILPSEMQQFSDAEMKVLYKRSYNYFHELFDVY